MDVVGGLAEDEVLEGLRARPQLEAHREGGSGPDLVCDLLLGELGAAPVVPHGLPRPRGLLAQQVQAPFGAETSEDGDQSSFGLGLRRVPQIADQESMILTRELILFISL